MTTASLTSSLLVRKGQATPVGRNNIAPIFKKIQHTATVKTIRKSVSLEERESVRVRLLAAKLGISQQSLMEQAIIKALNDATDNNGCICGSP